MVWDYQSEAPADRRFDVAVVGGGFAGLATAARLQAQGFATVVLEAHAVAGGCAGYFRRRGFSFDVGATTLVDFTDGGVGGELMDTIGMAPPPMDVLPGYVAWLPDRIVHLHRDQEQWHRERLATLGQTAAHRRFWAMLDTLADVFWEASRNGIKLPLRHPADMWNAMTTLPMRHWHLARSAFMTMGDALRMHGLRNDAALVGLLSMLIEDTVHATVDQAPLINAALGITIRGTGLSRAVGGMRGFITALLRHYQSQGGVLVRNCRVDEVTGTVGNFVARSSKGAFDARQIVSAVPAATAARIAAKPIGSKLQRYLNRDAEALGGAIVVFLGVPEDEVDDHAWTHHQILTDYDEPLGVGNNMFISVSAPGDLDSAPAGCRAVMISTHCDLGPWEGIDDAAYERQKVAIGDRLIANARRVYPQLGANARVHEIATPKTYARFAGRPNGAVGGVRQTLRNSNQFAIPHEVGVKGFHLVGDSTWPGLGTVACTLGSRIVAANVAATAGPTVSSPSNAAPGGLLNGPHDLVSMASLR